MLLEPVTTTAGSIQRITTRLADPMANGMRAALRRMEPSALSTPALQRLLAEAVPQGALDSDAAWALLVHCLALAAPDHHMGRVGLGVALQQARFAESRLVRLLSPSTDLLIALPRAVRFLIARGAAVNGRGLWELIRPAIRAHPDEAALERARTRVARDYYRTDPARTAPAAMAESLEPETTL